MKERGCPISKRLGCLFLLPATVTLASQLLLTSQSSSPGSSVNIPIQFASEGESVSGLQFDLEYDSSAMSLNKTLGDPLRTSWKRVYVVDLDPNTKRFLLIGFNQNPIPGGTLINLFINISQNSTSGPHALKLSNLLATDPYGDPVVIAGIDGTVQVQGTSGQGVPLSAQGVLSGASLLSGPVAPGEVITLIGSAIGPISPQQPVGSTSTMNLGGTSVLFDGLPAPLLYASPDQINAIVPYGVLAKGTTYLQVTSQGQILAGLPLSTAATVPAIFTLDSTGVGPGAILNQDSTVNSPSNPAEIGSIVSVFATGAGQTDPPGIDGQIAGSSLPGPLLPVSLRIGGLDAQVLYAGAAPGLIAGVLQVNLAVPQGVPSGPAVPIVLAVGTTPSPDGVTLAIR
jgi:uncharacterized protein (TIGR03437 family)